ncbi:MAG TPA: UDP-2,3-diacylglucosamine diphosphatase [Bacteroidetes bacterium]|nr:UDP-2,3-diacylglucosamine diphosphatase [Bacteroidota bacterium]
METVRKVYFFSDLHLGLPTDVPAVEREKLVVRWLDEISDTVAELFVVGDIFDYWFEYKYVIPKGFTRFLGKMAAFTDRGIPVHFFTGNHDVWMYDYFPEELGVTVHTKPFVYENAGKRFYIAHGDGLGPGDPGYKLLKGIFNNKVLQWMYKRLHPNFATWLAHRWSQADRGDEPSEFLGEEKEALFQHSKKILTNESIDYFIYGHRHLVLDHPLGNTARIIYLGDWITLFSYAVFDGNDLKLKYYKPQDG